MLFRSGITAIGTKLAYDIYKAAKIKYEYVKNINILQPKEVSKLDPNNEFLIFTEGVIKGDHQRELCSATYNVINNSTLPKLNVLEYNFGRYKYEFSNFYLKGKGRFRMPIKPSHHTDLMTTNKKEYIPLNWKSMIYRNIVNFFCPTNS